MDSGVGAADAGDDKLSNGSAGRGEKRRLATIDEKWESHARARAALIELKKNFVELKEVARQRAKAQQEAVKDKLVRPRSPQHRRLMKPREYLQSEPPSGNSTSYEEILQHVSHYVEDRTVEDQHHDLLEPADHSIWDDNFSTRIL